ncbi:hypothetical protein JZ751_014597, partial [Albula glossodonta]
MKACTDYVEHTALLYDPPPAAPQYRGCQQGIRRCCAKVTAKVLRLNDRPGWVLPVHAACISDMRAAACSWLLWNSRYVNLCSYMQKVTAIKPSVHSLLGVKPSSPSSLPRERWEGNRALNSAALLLSAPSPQARPPSHMSCSPPQTRHAQGKAATHHMQRAPRIRI